MLVLLASIACDTAPEERTYPERVPGPLSAGAAESVIEVPLGAPMGGYSSRCKILGSSSKQDNRQSPYAMAFDRSTGIQSRPTAKTLWLSNGDDDLVLIKFDAIYSFDGMVQRLEQELGDATGLDLDGKVVTAASHSHGLPANYHDAIHFYLGGDRYNREIFERYVDALTQVSLDAFEQLEPAAVGFSWNRDWDPDNRVYRDRREDNDELQVWDDWETGKFKDPYAGMLRVESAADGTPIAMAVTFGMHPTLGGGDNPMWTTDAVGGLERTLQEEFDEPVVVMHLQGSGGDASAAGSDHGWARMESIGDWAVDPLMAAWDATPVGTGDVDMETASRHIPTLPKDIHVTRGGAVDWAYEPWEDGKQSDGELYEADGTTPRSDWDEWNFRYGAAFCGSDEPLIPVESQSDVFPYDACMAVDLLSGIIAGTFDMNVEEFPLPMPSSKKAGTSASLLQGIPQLLEDGTVVEDQPLLIGFFPAEPTSLFGEQWRRRAKAELGLDHALLVGYAQDHEGYYLIPEDWLLGGYEPNINIWGPLQAEHVMEGVLTMVSDVLLTSKREHADPIGTWSPTEYADTPLAVHTPDATPNAGTWVTEAPEYFWVPEQWQERELDLSVPEECPRVSCMITLAFLGGDPAVDTPVVSLQQEQDDGSWVTLTTHSGRAITSDGVDMLVGWTPEPLYPPEAEQTHTYFVAWQAVGAVHDRAGLPVGTYRLHVDGQRYTGSETEWPFTSSAYSADSAPFEIVATDLELGWDGATLTSAYRSPTEGFRLVGLGGDSTGLTPVNGPAQVIWTIEDAEVVEDVTLSGGAVALTPPPGATELTIVDAYGNSGWLAL